MTSLLPPNLLRLFAPRPPLYYLPPSDVDFDERRKVKYHGIASILDKINDHDQNYIGTETNAARKRRLVVILIRHRKSNKGPKNYPNNYKNGTQNH